MQTLQDLLPEIARLRDREAIRWTNGVRTFVASYLDLYGTIGTVVQYFASQGIQKGDRVLVWAENRMEWAAVFWGCVASGVVAVPVDLRFSEELVRRIEEQSQAKLRIDGVELDRIANLPRVAAFPTAAVTRDDIVEIVYTSGTTGEPKGVIHRHRNICGNLRPFQKEIHKYERWARPFQPIRILDLLPLSHMFGQALGIYIPVLLGGAAIFTPEISSAKIIPMVRKNRITVIVAVPQMLANMKSEIERLFQISTGARSVPSRLWRYRKIHSAFGWKFWAFVAGGAPLDFKLEEFWGRLGFLVIQGYGLTEASPVVAVNHPFNAKRGSLGKPLPGTEVAIAGDGEILIRGESITTESGGWLHTGDLGSLDAEGRLYYRGRKKDLIVTADGLNVYPEDVERVLHQFQEVRESAVVSLPRDGSDQVHAAVILSDPDTDMETLVRQANDKLESHQRIKSWSVWPEDDFPRTASTMKIRRAEVRSRLHGGTAEAPQQKIVEPPLPERELSSMSSLERIELLSDLESKYQITLNEEEFAKLKSSRELEDWLRRSVRGRDDASRSEIHRPPSEWARLPPVRLCRRAFQQVLMVPLFRYYLPLTVTGLEHLKHLKPPVIFAANHLSLLDAPAVLAALPSPWRQRLAPAMGLEILRPYFEPDGFPVWRVWWTGLGYVLALGLFNAYPLPHELAGVRRALNYTGELINRGFCPLVFPEGKRSPDGKLQPFRPGIGMMALRLRVPIVPVHLDGLHEVYSVHDSWPRRGPVRVSFGKPLIFTSGTYEEIAEEVREHVSERDLHGNQRR
jgi:long-chain acyl-CoA synthetase